MSNMKAPTNGFLENPAAEGERKPINSELWHACAGPLVSLPPVGSLVVYFPQGHSEQVAASMQKETDFIPSYPNLPSNLICMLHNVTMQADPETDEVYAQMTLQPVQKCDKEALLASELALKQNRQPTEFFCKTLTASDTSTHGGFSVPRRAAEKIFPPLDYSMQPPAQEIVAKDLHDHTWTFKHIYRGQPKRHLLTTGWSVCVSTKRLYAGDSVLFIRDDKQQLFLGIKRANRQQPALSSSVISSDSMHIGILAAAAHAAANNSPFTIFYNPRAPSEFVVPFAKYQKAMYTRVSLGMRFRMMFETEDSGVRRYMGTITGISDMDPLRWKGSQWRNLQVGWDESTAGERPGRVSLWEIEPVVTPFYICPPPFFRPKLPGQPRVTEDGSDMESAFRRAMPWLGDDLGMKDAPNSMFPGLSLVQWMSMQQNNPFSGIQSGFLPSMGSSNPLHNNPSTEDLSKLLSFQAPAINTSNLQFNKANSQNHVSQLRQSSMAWPQQQMQKLLQSPLYQQQQNGQQQQSVSQVIQQQAPQQPQQQQQLQQQPQQPQMLQASNNGVLNSNYAQNQCLQRPMFNSQLREQLVTSNIQLQQGIHSSNMSSFHLPSLPQNLQVQQNAEQANLLQKNNQQTPSQQSPLQLQQSVSQKSQHLPQLQQLSQQGLSEQHLQLLQKLQQQQAQLVSPSSPLLQPHILQQQQSCQQNPQLQQLPLSQPQQQFSGNNFLTSALMQSQQMPVVQSQIQSKPLTVARQLSGMTDGEAPSCSTSPSTNNCRVSPSDCPIRNQGPAIEVGDAVLEHSINTARDIDGKSDIRIKHEFPNSRGPEQVRFKSAVADQLEVSSLGTSYCLGAGNMQQNILLPQFRMDGDVQSHPQNCLSMTTNMDGLAPDTLLSRGYDSPKDFQNFHPTVRSSIQSLDEEDTKKNLNRTGSNIKPGPTRFKITLVSSSIIIIMSLFFYCYLSRDEIPTSENLFLALVSIAVLLYFVSKHKAYIQAKLKSFEYLNANSKKQVIWFIGEDCDKVRKVKRVVVVKEGVEFYSNGDFYEGDFNKGRCNGSGVYHYFANGRYEGDWVDGRYDGYGVESWARGSRYRGMYRHGMRHGYGVYRFYTGDVYAGEWCNGQSHGFGVQTCSDGSCYVGEFKYGVKHGLGSYHFRNGDRYAGEYFGDRIHGFGVYHFANGHCYEGSWYEGIKQGYGMYTFRSRDTKCGEWNSGNLKTPLPPMNEAVSRAVQAARKAADKAVQVCRVDEQVNRAVMAANRAATAARVAAVRAVQN